MRLLCRRSGETLFLHKFGLEKRGRHQSPPPKPVTAAPMLRDSGARAVSVLNASFTVRMIPLKRSPDKAFGREEPAPEPVLDLGESSTARAMAAIFRRLHTRE